MPKTTTPRGPRAGGGVWGAAGLAVPGSVVATVAAVAVVPESAGLVGIGTDVFVVSVATLVCAVAGLAVLAARLPDAVCVIPVAVAQILVAVTEMAVPTVAAHFAAELTPMYRAFCTASWLSWERPPAKRR